MYENWIILRETNILNKNTGGIQDDKKDIALIKKIVSRANDNSIIKCVTCYVDTKTDDIIFQKPKNFYSLEESQLSQYCNFMKKGVSGKLGSTVSEITTRENLLGSPQRQCTGEPGGIRRNCPKGKRYFIHRR